MSSEKSQSHKRMFSSPVSQISPFHPSYQSQVSDSERQRSCSLLHSGRARRSNEEFASNIIAELIEKAKMLSGELKNSNEISRELLLENKRLWAAYELLKGKFFTLLAKKNSGDSADPEFMQTLLALTLQEENEILRIEKFALTSELKYVNTHIVDPDYFYPNRRATRSQEAITLNNSDAIENNKSQDIEIKDLQNEITKLNLLLQQSINSSAQLASQIQNDQIRSTRRLQEPVSQIHSPPQGTSAAATPARTPKVLIEQIYQNSAIQGLKKTVIAQPRAVPVVAAPVATTIISAAPLNNQQYYLVSTAPQAIRNNKLSSEMNNQAGSLFKICEANQSSPIVDSKRKNSESYSDLNVSQQSHNKNLSSTNHTTNKTQTITIVQNFGSSFNSIPYSQNTLNYNSAPPFQQKAISVISNPEYMTQKAPGATVSGVNETYLMYFEKNPLKSSNKIQSSSICLPGEMKRQRTGIENDGNPYSNREIIVPAAVDSVSRKQSSYDLKNSATQIATIIRNTQAAPQQQDNLKKSDLLQKESTKIVISPQLPQQFQQQKQQAQRSHQM